MARPFRYTFILALAGAGTVLAAVGGWRFARASAPVSGPIVLISVDALRADRLPIYGYDGVETPAIDALAADGVIFERAYSHSPSTLPSHAALMSGRLPFRTGVRGNLGRIASDETLLAEILSDRAYATAAVVSSYTLRRDSGIAQGFTFFDDELPEPWTGRRDDLQRDGAESVAVAEGWLSSAGTERAFLFLHLNDPHQPHHARADHPASYEGDVEYADQVVADFIDYLKSHQLYDQSTVILLSDHGEGLGDHGEESHGLLVYDEMIRVPLVIKPAASEQGGRRVSELVQLVDILPTIVDLAKAPLPDDLDGHSLTPLLDGTSEIWPRLAYGESLYGRQHFGWPRVRTITDGRYRFVDGAKEELFDLTEDPGQTNSLIDSEPAVADRLRTALARLTAMDTQADDLDAAPDVRDRLAALGDVGTLNRVPGPTDVTAAVWDVSFVEAYRSAVNLLADGQWPRGIAELERLARNRPDATNIWRHLAKTAERAGRHDLASEAYRHVLSREPDAVDAQLGAAQASFQLRRFEDARRRAEAVVSLAADIEPATTARGYELLVRIALARQDPATAFARALEGQNAQPGLPLIAYVDGRVLQDAGRDEEAVEAFERAAGELNSSHGAIRLADLHLRAAESLIRLDRLEEAESQYAEEIAAFPHSIAARAGLATLFHTTGQSEQAGAAIADLLQFTPTPDAYNLAARLWTTFGNVDQASQTRAEAARLFAAPLSRTTQQ